MIVYYSNNKKTKIGGRKRKTPVALTTGVPSAASVATAIVYQGFCSNMSSESNSFREERIDIIPTEAIPKADIAASPSKNI